MTITIRARRIIHEKIIKMKLQQGDYVTDLTEEQFDELMEIEGHKTELDFYEQINFITFGDGILTRLHKPKTLLSFTEFKQRAINTFEI